MSAQCHRPGSEHSHTRVGARRTAGVVLMAAAITLGAFALALPHAARASGFPVPRMQFVYRGDIWSYDGDTGSVERLVLAEGRTIGHSSWALDREHYAYEVQRIEGINFHAWVVFVAPALGGGGPPVTHIIEDARYPEVSPDGRYCLYQAAREPTLHVFDSQGEHTWEIPSAGYGAWVAHGANASSTIAYTGFPNVFPSNAGFFLHQLDTGSDTQVAATYPGETASQSNVWFPRPGQAGTAYLLEKYSVSNVEIVTLVDGELWPLMGVMDYGHVDFRWLVRRQAEGVGVPDQVFVELRNQLSLNNDIFEVVNPLKSPLQVKRFRDSSFDFEESLPTVAPFTDVGAADGYAPAIAFLGSHEIVAGFGDGTFGAGANSKRAQFAKMIVGALDLEVSDGLPPTPFADLGEDVSPHYPRGFVAAAYAAGLVEGVDATHFEPYAQVTRAQVMTMVWRAAKEFAGDALRKPPDGWSGGLSWFDDVTHGKNAQLAEYNGLLAGIDLAGWDPWAPASRGEMAQMLFNLMGVRGPLVAE